MKTKKQLTITRSDANYIINHGKRDIFDAYEKPSKKKIDIYNTLYYMLKKGNYKDVVIFGYNCNYFTLYAFKNNLMLKITYANTYKYKII